jgi:hypothetical protein
MKSRRLPAREADSPADRVRHGVWRHCLPLFVLGASSAIALAACPPNEADGALLTSGGQQLAWRPLLQGDIPVAPAAIPMARHFALTVQLCEGSTASTAILRKVDATMPEHRHGMNYQPRISALGNGRFRVEGLMFHMSGRWQIEFEVQSGKDVLRLLHDIKIR